MESKLTTLTAGLMITVAVIFDIIQALLDLLHFIPLVGNIFAIISTSLLSVFAWLTFYLWMKIKGIDFASPKRSLSLGGGFIFELIPILNALPGWTLAVILIIGSMRAEELIAKTTGINVNISSGVSPIPNPTQAIKNTPLNK